MSARVVGTVQGKHRSVMIDWSAVAFLFFVLAFCNAAEEDISACYAEERQPYSLMGTRTVYELARGNVARLPIDSKCKPIQIWALIRHGTRYPRSNDINQFISLRQVRDKIIENHEKRGKGYLCRADLENLRKWDLNPKPNEIIPEALTPQGEVELQAFAKRLQVAFPELLQVDPRNVSQNDFRFRATEKQRAQASLQAFAQGLFGKENSVKPEPTPKNDSLLYTYKNCPAYEESLITDRIDAETNKFIAGPEFQNLLHRVSKRLGFDCILNSDTLLLMYDVCRYERAWHADRKSLWCAAFKAEDIRILEYREDIGCYYYCGPGRRINEMLGCPPLQDMVRHFRNLKMGDAIDQEPKGIFYFSHTVTLQATMAAMGIGKDSMPLLSTNYRSMENRSFRTSFIGPFGGNIVAVYYKCNDAQMSNKVMIHVSERLWGFDGCDGGVCDWEYLNQKFGKAADQCNLDFCYK